jgi:O-antigen/teichoic acid export membrane protein
MATLKRNVIANLVGGAWIALLTLTIVPIQINLLGMESYGLIGFIATLQIVFSVLDLGLSTTVTRELAGDPSAGRAQTWPLVRTALTVYWSIAGLMGVVLLASAEVVGRSWFNSQSVGPEDVTFCLRVASIMLAIRWPVALYAGVLAGVERMDVLNIAKAATATLRLLGGVLVVLMWRRLDAFLAWTALSALMEVTVFAVACHRSVPNMDWRPGFSMSALRSVWGFSLSMNALAILGVAITQLDRLIISKVLPLQDLGLYSLAYSTATSISLILSALSSALMPSLASAYASNARSTLLSRYDNANRVMLYATGLVLFALVFFGQSLLVVWVNPLAASGAWRSLALLAGGFWLSAAVSGAYNVGVSCRQPGMLLRLSALSAIIYAPLLYGLIHLFGIEGAAAAWLALNGGYALVIVPVVHRTILKIPVAPWYVRTLLPFAILGIATFGLARLLVEYFACKPELELAAMALAALAYMFVGYSFLGVSIRNDVSQALRRTTRGWKRAS